MTTEFDETLQAADSDELYYPEEFDFDFELARLESLAKLIQELPNAKVSIQDVSSFQDGSLFACLDVFRPNDCVESWFQIAISAFGNLATVERHLKGDLLVQIRNALQEFGYTFAGCGKKTAGK